MKLHELMRVAENVAICDNATNELIDTKYADELKNADVLKISSEEDGLTAYIVVENKHLLFAPYECDIIELWDKLFSGCNLIGYDTETNNWYVEGIDVYGGHVDYRYKMDLIDALKSDIMETLFCEAVNERLKEFATDFEL